MLGKFSEILRLDGIENVMMLDDDISAGTKRTILANVIHSKAKTVRTNDLLILKII